MENKKRKEEGAKVSSSFDCELENIGIIILPLVGWEWARKMCTDNTAEEELEILRSVFVANRYQDRFTSRV